MMLKRLNTTAIIALPIAVLGGLLALVVLGAPEPIGSFTTTLEGRTEGQVRNIRRAAGLLDGVKVEPGEVFSFNETLGDRSTDNGFVSAGTIVEGKLDDGLGGGICQVSSTLYNAALLAGLEIVERHPHSYPVRSVPPGRDATVVFGDKDLRIRNNLEKPVTIRANTSGGRLVVELLGEEQSDARIRISVETEDSVRPVSGPRSPRTRHCTATVWREQIKEGRPVSRELVSTDTYKMTAE